jgi:hypothetical protein
MRSFTAAVPLDRAVSAVTIFSEAPATHQFRVDIQSIDREPSGFDTFRTHKFGAFWDWREVKGCISNNLVRSDANVVTESFIYNTLRGEIEYEARIETERDYWYCITVTGVSYLEAVEMHRVCCEEFGRKIRLIAGNKKEGFKELIIVGDVTAATVSIPAPVWLPIPRANIPALSDTTEELAKVKQELDDALSREKKIFASMCLHAGAISTVNELIAANVKSYAK